MPSPEVSDAAEPLILSALNDFLYCPRRCALHRIEGLWTDNASTLSGDIAHETADDPGYRQTVDALGTVLRIERALPLFCRKLNLVGKSDIVEFHRAAGVVGISNSKFDISNFKSEISNLIPRPVDYKIGKRRKWDNDDVQLCAQGLCLEEMLGVNVPGGAVYHVATRRRREVPFDGDLRLLTLRTIEQVRDLLAENSAPPAELRPQCEGCSMHATCMPELTQRPGSLDRFHRELFTCDAG